MSEPSKNTTDESQCMLLFCRILVLSMMHVEQLVQICASPINETLVEETIAFTNADNVTSVFLRR